MQWLLAKLATWTVSDWLLLIYDVVTAIAAIVAILALKQIRAQAKAMTEQLGQMKAAGKQTDDLISVAKDQATTLGTAAKAAQESADAALLNAQALMNSERPWVFVRNEISERDVRSGPDGQELLPKIFRFNLLNMGRTPAEILFHVGNYTICPPREVDDIKIPAVLGAQFVHKRVIAPQEGFEFDTFYVEGPGLEENDFLDINRSRKRIVFFGVIRYRDTLGGSDTPVRETCYCYWFNPQDRSLVMGGPTGANRHT